MRGANGVAAHLLEDSHLALDSRTGIHGTQGALVLVHADALDLDVLAVEREARVGIVVEPAVAIGSVIGVHGLAVHLYLGSHRIEVGGLGGPEAGVCCFELGLDGLCLPCSKRLRLGGNGTDGLLRAAVLGEDRLAKRHGDVCVTAVRDGGRELGGNGAAALRLEVRRGHTHAVLGHGDLAGHHEVHVAANARARVPTARGRLVVDLHGDDVLLARLEVGCEVKREGRVAVGVVAQLRPVDPYRGIHVDAIEVDAHLLACEGLVHVEALAVPAYAARLVGALCLHGGRVVLVDAVVVGQGDVLPGGVVKGLGLSTAGVAQVELPVVVEALGANTCVADVVNVNNFRHRRHLHGGLGAYLGCVSGTFRNGSDGRRRENHCPRGKRAERPSYSERDVPPSTSCSFSRARAYSHGCASTSDGPARLAGWTQSVHSNGVEFLGDNGSEPKPKRQTVNFVGV